MQRPWFVTGKAMAAIGKHLFDRLAERSLAPQRHTLPANLGGHVALFWKCISRLRGSERCHGA